MKNDKIIIISLFFYEVFDNIRISTVYHLLKERGADVELITTDFNHRKKQKHNQFVHPKDITFLPVPEYHKNLSIRRLFSHAVFACRLKRYLNKLQNKPSIVYVLVPAVSAGKVVASFCQKNHIPLIVDVIDLWPESLIILSKYRKAFNVLTVPWKRMARKVYAAADFLFAGSEDYAKYAQKYNHKTKAKPVYLGVNVEKTKKVIQRAQVAVKKTNNEKWICFGGMLGNSYDIDIILEGFKKLSKDLNNVQLLFVGGGQESRKILKYKKEYDLKILVTGFLDYADYLKYLSYSDIAINSFKKDTRVAYSYKFNDYVSVGLPVLNNVKGEMARLIEDYTIGRNFEHTVDSFVFHAKEMLEDDKMLGEMRKNVTFVARQVLEQHVVYRDMMDQLTSRL